MFLKRINFYLILYQNLVHFYKQKMLVSSFIILSKFASFETYITKMLFFTLNAHSIWLLHEWKEIIYHSKHECLINGCLLKFVFFISPLFYVYYVVYNFQLNGTYNVYKFSHLNLNEISSNPFFHKKLLYFSSLDAL